MASESEPTKEEIHEQRLASGYYRQPQAVVDGKGITKDGANAWRFCEPLASDLADSWKDKRFVCNMRLDRADGWERVSFYPREGFKTEPDPTEGEYRTDLPRFKPGRVLEDDYMCGRPLHLTVVTKGMHERGLSEKEQDDLNKVVRRFTDAQGNPVTVRGNILLRRVSTFTPSGGFCATIAKGWPFSTQQHEGIVEALEGLRDSHHGYDFTVSL